MIHDDDDAPNAGEKNLPQRRRLYGTESFNGE